MDDPAQEETLNEIANETPNESQNESRQGGLEPPVPDPRVFEKLGAFYLGRRVDAGSGHPTPELLLYDSRDLLTHALCVGMTGSGKTGLCIDLLEEAALDGVPALVIDPKGDLGNLLLTFPDLAPGDFEPWVDAEEAARAGRTVPEHAAAQAELWRQGLASWGQDGERIARLRESAEICLYTPGSEAGRPLSILASLAAPGPAVREDPDLFRERIHTLTGSLLGLLGLDADPVRSREYILVANILEVLWSQGRDLDLAGLVAAVQNPPLSRVGVLELESFYPARERFELALTLNNLLAAPTFQAWTRGEPVDVDRLLFDPRGRPRVAVLHIAHLAQAERMFFVSLLLDQVLGWLRGRPGTTSLRALLYMDEIFGFLPPVAEPPSKRPLLTLLKQARAFGLGVVLATQNPADVDYKALANLGTWFLGRLQTERDRDRLLDGLMSASGAGLERKELERLLAGLGQRTFLLHNVHEEEPVLFRTRWAMSYLKGPLTRAQVRRLSGEAEAERGEERSGTGGGREEPALPAAEAAPAPSPESSRRPLLPPEVPQAFLAPAGRPPRGAGGEVFYQSALLGLGRVSFYDRKHGVEHEEEVALALGPEDLGGAPGGGVAGVGGVDWRQARPVPWSAADLASEPPLPGGFAEVFPQATEGRNFKAWEKELADLLYRSRRLELHRSPLLDEVSRPEEDAREFRIRLAEDAREARDLEVSKLKEEYRGKFDRLERRELTARQALERESDQARQRTVETALSVAGTLVTALLGRRRSAGRATSAFKGIGRALEERGDVERAGEKLEAVQEERRRLEREMAERIEELEARYDPLREELEELEVRPRRSDVEVERVVLLWVPMGEWPPA